MALTVSALADQAGLSADTVRYYERVGLLPEPARSAAGYRLYDQAAVGRLRLIKGAQRAGLRLREIGELLQVADRGQCPCGHTETLLRERLAEVQAELARLQALETELTRLLEQHPDPTCPETVTAAADWWCALTVPTPASHRKGGDLPCRCWTAPARPTAPATTARPAAARAAEPGALRDRPAPPVSPSVQPTRPATANAPSMTASGSRHEGPHPRREATMSTGEHKQLISGLVEAVWNQHNTAAIDCYFDPGLREEVAEHYHQLLDGFPDLQVRIEGDLIAEGDMVVARLTLTGTQTGPFAGRDGSGRFARWSSIRIYRIDNGKVAETWAMQDRLGLLQQLGALPELESVNWAGGRRVGDRSGRS